jgi:hypothetical protein
MVADDMVSMAASRAPGRRLGHTDNEDVLPGKDVSASASGHDRGVTNSTP